MAEGCWETWPATGRRAGKKQMSLIWEVGAGREGSNQAGGWGRLVLGGRLVGTSGEAGTALRTGEGEEGEPRSWRQKRSPRLIAGCIGKVAESECWGDEARKAIPETGRLRAAGLGAAEKPGREELPGPMPWWSLLWPGSEGHGAGDGCVQRSTWGDSSQPLPPPPESCRAHPSLHPQNVPQPVPVAQLRLEPFTPPCAKPCLPPASPRPCPCPALPPVLTR